MRRQRFIYTLPSQDDSVTFDDSDNTSIISSPYSYPETVWSPIISPESEGLVPFCIYQYPFLPMPTDQLHACNGILNAQMAQGSFHSLDSMNLYCNEFSEVQDIVSGSPSYNTPCGDGFSAEEYTYNSITYENIENARQDLPRAYPMVTNYGAVTILLRHLLRVDISPVNAVYVTNPPSNCVAAINGTGDKSCVIHPNGRILQDGHEIHLATLNKKAKLSKRGVVFTSTDHCLSYLVDASGTKTTAEKFKDLNQDFSLEVFYNVTMAEDDAIQECFKMRDESIYKNYWNGDEVWFIGGFRIKQDQRGDVRVTREGSRQVIRSSPTTGQVSVRTLQSEFTIGRYPNNYLVVRKGNKHVMASIKGFNVQNGTQKAGFNNFGKLVLF